MPLQRCEDGGKGWRWGDKGKCYTGPGAKKKAIKQGVAIEGPKKFAAKANKIKASQRDIIGAVNELSLVKRIATMLEMMKRGIR